MTNPNQPLEKVVQSAIAGDWNAVAEGFSNTGVPKLLGIVVDLSNLNEPVCEINPTTEVHLGGLGQHYVNGMVTSAMLDLSIGLIGLNYAKEGFFATSSISIDFQKPLESGRIYAISRYEKRVGKNVHVEATVYNGQHEPRVRAHGTVRVGINRSSS